MVLFRCKGTEKKRINKKNTYFLPEGANRKVVCREKRIDDNDCFGMLMATVGTGMNLGFKDFLM